MPRPDVIHLILVRLSRKTDHIGALQCASTAHTLLFLRVPSRLVLHGRVLRSNEICAVRPDLHAGPPSSFRRHIHVRCSLYRPSSHELGSTRARAEVARALAWTSPQIDILNREPLPCTPLALLVPGRQPELFFPPWIPLGSEGTVLVDSFPEDHPARSPSTRISQWPEKHRLIKRVDLGILALGRHGEAEQPRHLERSTDPQLLDTARSSRVRVSKRVRHEILLVEPQRASLSCIHVHGIMVYAHGLQRLPVSTMQPIRLQIVLWRNSEAGSLFLLAMLLASKKALARRIFLFCHRAERCALLVQRSHDVASTIVRATIRAWRLHLDVPGVRVPPLVSAALLNGLACLVREGNKPLRENRPGIMRAVTIVPELHLEHHLWQLFQQRLVRAGRQPDYSPSSGFDYCRPGAAPLRGAILVLRSRSLLLLGCLLLPQKFQASALRL